LLDCDTIHRKIVKQFNVLQSLHPLSVFVLRVAKTK
jgi:hypothetical protein